jgi:5,10-methylenetetrahydromethanopterin reductase
MEDHMGPSAAHANLIPGELIHQFAIAGTPDECVSRVRDLAKIGFDEISFRPYATRGRSRLDMVEAVASMIVNSVRVS